MRIATAALAALLGLTSACASTATGAAAAIVEADEKMVESCKFLGDVYGKTLIGGAANNLAINNAKVDAREKAAKMGASHLVFRVLDGGDAGQMGHVEARAYRCPE